MQLKLFLFSDLFIFFFQDLKRLDVKFKNGFNCILYFIYVWKALPKRLDVEFKNGFQLLLGFHLRLKTVLTKET